MKKLTKNRSNKKLFGVCSGLADWLNLDATIVRLLFVVGTIMTGSLLLWIYLILAMVLSDE
jgi:phage shock protein C